MKQKLILFIFVIFSVQLSFAQNNQDKKTVQFSASLQTNHLWRGLVITDMPMLGAITTFNITNGLSAGFWGAASFANDNDGTHYKEINYYVQYAASGFSIGLWDLFNTRSAQKVDIWEYDKDSTGHLIDMRMSYEFGKNFPLALETDIILYGAGDRAVSGSSTKQRYSTYFQVSYPVIRNKEVNLKTFVGTGFALNADTHLYGNGKNKFDVVNLGITASKNVKLANWNIPVSLSTIWNPSQKFARVQLAIQLF